MLTSVQDYTGNVNGTVYWYLNLLDARGNAVSETFGNGLWLQNTFDPLTGEATSRQAGSGGQTTNVQNLAYHWDKAGNLEYRQDLRQGLTESFGYDALDRLVSTSGPGTQALTIVYDAIGNVTSRTDIAGSYSYDPLRKHAVTAAGGNSYGYDANGNMTSRNGATIAWTSYNLPSSLSASGYTASFNYAPDRSRWRQVATYSGGTETTIYVAGLVEKLTTAARVHWKHRIAVPAGEVQVVRRSDGSNEVLYITTDHLGSTDTVTDASASVLARESFGAWGARRAANWQGNPSSAEWQSIANTTRRGYTGHEQLDNVLLVHMNGRVYDPAIGRFLSADPYVDGAETTQGWNRFSYVHNRPVVLTDPSGYYSIGEGMNWKIVWINGVDLENVTVTGRSPEVDIALSRGMWLGNLRNGLSPPSGGLPLNEEGLESITVTASRLPANRPRKDTPQSENQCQLIMLAQGPEEGGYYTYGTPGDGAGQFGRPEAINLILDVGYQWSRTGAADFGVGNISLTNGGYFAGHSPTGSHTTGLGFDVRPIRLDGAQLPTTWTSPSYDRAGTQSLVNMLNSSGQVRNIFFNDPKIAGVSPYKGHDNHLHVNVRSTCGRK